MIFTTLETYFSSRSWRLQLLHLHNLYQISHTFFVLQHISFSFARDRITFYFNARSLSETILWSVHHHTCHAWCVWKVDESSLELFFFFSNSETNFVTEFSGAILRCIGRIPSPDGSRYHRPSASSVTDATGFKAQALTFHSTFKKCCFWFLVVSRTTRQGKPPRLPARHAVIVSVLGTLVTPQLANDQGWWMGSRRLNEGSAVRREITATKWRHGCFESHARVQAGNFFGVVSVGICALFHAVGIGRSAVLDSSRMARVVFQFRSQYHEARL